MRMTRVVARSLAIEKPKAGTDPQNPANDRKKPNLFDLYDMGGNVAEWIGDFYEFYPEPGQDPDWIDLSQRELRLARGGGYSAEVYVSQTYWRAGTLGTVTTPTIGVRCARDR
jgi:formylglycine-generating enzyme required for sulfatase activity